MAPVLARGFETAFVPAGDETERVPVAAAVCDALVAALPVVEADDLELDAELDAELDSDGCSAAVKNGFELLPPVPCVKSRLNEVSELC